MRSSCKRSSGTQLGQRYKAGTYLNSALSSLLELEQVAAKIVTQNSNSHKGVEFVGQKHKRFREFRTPFPLRDIRENPRSYVRACVAGDGAICPKNRKIVSYHGANLNTRNGAHLRSPSLNMAPGIRLSGVTHETRVLCSKLCSAESVMLKLCPTKMTLPPPRYTYWSFNFERNVRKKLFS